jgi:hypothetical protein
MIEVYFKVQRPKIDKSDLSAGLRIVDIFTTRSNITEID